MMCTGALQDWTGCLEHMKQGIALEPRNHLLKERFKDLAAFGIAAGALQDGDAAMPGQCQAEESEDTASNMKPVMSQLL